MMKNIAYLIVAFLVTMSFSAQDLMIVNNTFAPMNGAIRLHSKYNNPNPELGDIPLAIPAYGQIWINNGPGFPNSIPFSALNNPSMSFYTPTLGAAFAPGSLGASFSQTVLQWNSCCATDFKWSCIKTDIGGYFQLDPEENGYPFGYIQIAPPYNTSMGEAVITNWGYRALSAAPNEVFAVNDFEYNSSFPIIGSDEALNFINGISPFGGYMVMVTVY